MLHPASVSASLVHSADVLKSHDGSLFRLKALFGPQHGYLGQTQDNMIEWQGFKHPSWGIPVYSLYGEHREFRRGLQERGIPYVLAVKPSYGWYVPTGGERQTVQELAQEA